MKVWPQEMVFPIYSMLAVVKAIKIGAQIFGLNKAQARKALTSLNLPESIIQKKQVIFYAQMSLQLAKWATRFLGKDIPNSSKNAVLLGAFAASTDELSDQFDVAPTQILNTLIKGNPEKKMETCERLYRHLLQQEGVDQDQFFELGEAACAAQEQSLKQKSPSVLSQEALQFITYEKGGRATQWYACLFPSKPGLTTFLFDIGVFLQLNNDLFDIYKDREEGQQTLFTNTQDFKLLRAEYEHVLDRCLHACRNTLTQSELRLMAAVAFVYFEQLLDLQTKGGADFNVHKTPRKELVCDMERMSNRVKAIRYFSALERR